MDPTIMPLMPRNVKMSLDSFLTNDNVRLLPIGGNSMSMFSADTPDRILDAPAPYAPAQSQWSNQLSLMDNNRMKMKNRNTNSYMPFDRNNRFYQLNRFNNRWMNSENLDRMGGSFDRYRMKNNDLMANSDTYNRIVNHDNHNRMKHMDYTWDQKHHRLMDSANRYYNRNYDNAFDRNRYNNMHDRYYDNDRLNNFNNDNSMLYWVSRITISMDKMSKGHKE